MPPKIDSSSTGWFTKIAPLKERNYERCKEWIRKLEGAFYLTNVQEDEIKVAIAVQLTEGDITDDIDALNDGEKDTWNHFLVSIRAICNPYVSVQKIDLIQELQAIPYSGDPKELITEIDKITARDTILQLGLPPDMYSACALKALETTNEDLADYLRSSIDLADYHSLRSSLLRMSSRKKAPTKWRRCGKQTTS